MFEKILIPTDGSDPSASAAASGMDLAVDQEATVHFLYVIEPLQSSEGGAQQVLESMRRSGERTVRELAEEAEEKGVEAVTEVVDGTPSKEIVEYARANDIDVIVMGTHGRTGLRRRLLGSVTEKVVRLSDIPVLTIQTRPEAE